MEKLYRTLTTLILIATLSGCGGGNDADNTPPPIDKTSYNALYSDSEKKASAFLHKTTFGPTMDEIKALATYGDYEKWIETEFSKPTTKFMDWANANVQGIGEEPDLASSIDNWQTYSQSLVKILKDGWWVMAVEADDQLRQRVAVALSEIFVISEQNIKNRTQTFISYYDMLLKNSFGNFKTLLEDVTYHPAMGRYLTYASNRKANPETGTTPDENYAREVMQLFTIGLYRTNNDGTTKKDGNGDPLPTYSQKDIEEMARVFTGLVISGENFFAKWSEPMKIKESNHDTGGKTVLGHTIPGGDTRTDINAALDILFNHPNAGPFFARRLIQRLTTSNPSPQYIGRVASAFNNNGEGVRGDMKAIIRAILLDPEAYAQNSNPTTFGKLREPIMFISNLLRATNAAKGENIMLKRDTGAPTYTYEAYNLSRVENLPQSVTFDSPSVFNYFEPDDAPFSLQADGIAAPEFEAFDPYLHHLLAGIISQNKIYRDLKLSIDLNLEELKRLAENKKTDEMVAYLDLLLTSGKLSEDSRISITTYLNEHLDFDPDTLAKDALVLMITTPDYAIQK